MLRSFDLRRDQREAEEIHEAVTGGVRSAGTNLWVLMFAILVASIGLNVNSTAVIIGAMLISPLMGPIVAIGYGAGVNDFGLIKRAVRTLGLFVGISLLTATLYFSVSPLSQAQSELLARTTPTVWDVAIAFFGGAAGIVALTRREFSNVVPGVAIATALMPPLCTAGFGLATRNLAFFGGAFYLFSINAVFIALATLLVVKVLRLPARADIDPVVRRRTRLLIGGAVTAMLVPSVYLAWQLVQAEYFSASAARLVRELAADARYIVLASDIDARQRRLTLTLGGDVPPAGLAAQLAAQLKSPTARTASVDVRFLGSSTAALQSLREELTQTTRGATAQTSVLQRQLAQLQVEASSAQTIRNEQIALLAELRAEYPEARTVNVAIGEQRRVSDSSAAPVTVVHLDFDKSVPVDETRLRARLAARFPTRRLDLLVTKAQ
ncbi:DUF389 domain-containing protein [Gemmatimonas phototrophica]|uniref:DUF389 domain-containing protein n=1 Tax=Gemmatimonas phototrophica TaxID=1379270 RepID=UPI001313E9CC|nr:DUF389 domain-containing protein [Gemmatimonas phototrophica]